MPGERDVADRIHDIPTCAELVSRIVAEAEAIIATRLNRVMSARKI